MKKEEKLTPNSHSKFIKKRSIVPPSFSIKNRELFVKIYLLPLLITLQLFLSSCKEDQTRPTAQIPVLISAKVADITQTSAISGGTIVNDGGASITSRGVCWYTSVNPTISNFKTSDGIGDGTYTSNINNLFPGKIYHVRAYAINSEGIGYGPDIAFTTISSTELTIGDTIQGGIIFYVNGTYPNQYGLVCASNDQGTRVPWYDSWDYYYYGTTTTAIGSGQTNTSSLVGILGDGYYAAKVCDEMVLNGFDDWFLPSRDELGLMFTNLKCNGFGNFTNSCYWSSSEYSKLEAYAQYFDTGRKSYNNKIHTYSIRAVKTFGNPQDTQYKSIISSTSDCKQ